MLPMKPSSLTLVTEVAQVLRPHLQQITDAWRRRMAEEFAFDERVLAVLERLNIASSCQYFYEENFSALEENWTYYGTRLAKLQVDTRAVARSLELSQETCEPYWAGMKDEKQGEARAALDMLSSATFVTVSGTYFDTQRRESTALLAVLDAELSASGLPALLERVLQITAGTFNASLGVALLRDPETNMLRVKASVGFEEQWGEELSIQLGHGFSGRIAETGEPAMLPDLSASNGVLNPYLRPKARALWGVPLRHVDEVIGVLLIGFPRPYEWLPTERELLRAIADRSALAIDRARMTDALRQREAQIAELSNHLLKVQEDERKRISRELHDETGQALMVIRLYLGMMDSSLTASTAKSKVRETLEVVDRTIDGLRRIIARLSPLVLQELGLIAAIRKEAKDLTKSSGVKARVTIDENVGRLAPDMEAAIYRVVQEALHNIAKHAKAKTVHIQMARHGGELWLQVEDDGIGLTKASPDGRQTFGLRGMKERISMLGGSFSVTSIKGEGTKLAIKVPAARSGLETLFARSQPVSDTAASASSF